MFVIYQWLGIEQIIKINMKIGILTFHRALNYGAILQCYALSQVLKGMGHEVEVIDYRPDYIEKYRDPWNVYAMTKAKGVVAKVKVALGVLVYLKPKRRAGRNFNNFIAKYIRLSNKVVENIQDIPNDYDVYVLGSDQIWNPVICDGYSTVFWGQFNRKKSSKLITYAVSLGLISIPEKDKEIVKEYVSSFHAISVRENSLKIQLSELKGIRANMVLDPTLLASPKIFSEIAIRPSIDKYVLLITLEKDFHALEFARRIAKQLNCKVVRIAAIRNLYLEKIVNNAINRFGVSPEDYCGLFKYATCIVSISFHATAFSLMFKRNFYVLESEGKDRAYNLLSYLGLEDRMVLSTSDVQFTPVDYSHYDELIERKRNESLEFLIKAIS